MEEEADFGSQERGQLKCTEDEFAKPSGDKIIDEESRLYTEITFLP